MVIWYERWLIRQRSTHSAGSKFGFSDIGPGANVCGWINRALYSPAKLDIELIRAPRRRNGVVELRDLWIHTPHGTQSELKFTALQVLPILSCGGSQPPLPHSWIQSVNANMHVVESDAATITDTEDMMARSTVTPNMTAFIYVSPFTISQAPRYPGIHKGQSAVVWGQSPTLPLVSTRSSTT
jgi:hypothetical protein